MMAGDAEDDEPETEQLCQIEKSLGRPLRSTERIVVTRMAAFEPAPFLVSDPEYTAAMGGANQDASVMHGISQWLDDTIISVPEIEEFKRELADKGMR